MRLTSLAAGLVALLAVPAPAAPNYDYQGACGFLTVNDRTPGGQLGGPDEWYGEIDVTVVALDAVGMPAAVPISAECEIVVNGIPQGVALSASGTGAAVGAAPFSFTFRPYDYWELCTSVTVAGESSRVCDAPIETTTG